MYLFAKFDVSMSSRCFDSAVVMTGRMLALTWNLISGVDDEKSFVKNFLRTSDNVPHCSTGEVFEDTMGNFTPFSQFFFILISVSY